MSLLTQLQKEFQNFIITGQDDIHESIETTPSVTVDTRLKIYKNAYKSRLIESLAVTYPALYIYLGTQAFEDLCARYIDAHPSRHHSIRWFGDTLALFLNQYYDRSHSFLGLLADFEWRMSMAFDAADSSRIQVADMAQVSPEMWGNLTFILHPSVQRADYFYNIIPLWNALIHNSPMPKMVKDSKATPLILWRTPDYMTQFYSLSDHEAWAIDQLRCGASFGTLCEGLCAYFNPEEVGMQAASYLKHWIQNGMIAELINK